MNRISVSAILSIVSLFVLLVAVKFGLAVNLALFGDEAFYWQSSIRPAISYVDHPPLTAALVRLGTLIFGDTTFGVRFWFLVLGVGFPVLIFYLAKMIHGQGTAWWCAGLSVVFPGVAFIGLFAVPDVLIILLTALFLWSIACGIRAPDWRTWAAIGITGMLGLLTHYRFSLAVFSALIYLLFSQRGRSLFTTPLPWIAAGFIAMGILPSVIWNIQTNFEPLNYYFSGRHNLSFEGERLLQFVLRQMLVATPFLFAGLVITVAYIIRLVRLGDEQAKLFLVFAITPFLVFFLASPFESSKLTTEHWPLPAYIPLLIYFPSAFSHFFSRRSKLYRAVGSGLMFVPAVCLIAWVGLELAGVTTVGGFRRAHTGWNELARTIEQKYLKELPSGAKANLLASDYKLAAILEFMLHDRAEVFVLDSDKNRRHGRALQIKIWNMSHQDLARRIGQDGLIILRLSEEYIADNIYRYTPVVVKEKFDLLQQLCGTFRRMRLLEQLRLDMPLRVGKRPRKILFEIYLGLDINPTSSECR